MELSMTATTFDTLKFARRLEAAGFQTDQATAFAEAQRDAFAEAVETQLATKEDIYHLDKRLETMQFQMKELEIHMTLRLGSIMVVGIGVIATLMKLLQ
jgi:predicted RNase H-like nuclease (RuvC/YqgF family)